MIRKLAQDPVTAKAKEKVVIKMNKYNLLSITVMTVAAIVGQLVVAEEGGATPFIIEQDENITITSKISHILNGEYKVRNSNLIVKYIDSTGAGGCL